MNQKKILEKGYFPKELPPPFETRTFSAKQRYIKKKWGDEIQKIRIPRVPSESNKSIKRRVEEFLSKYETSKCLTYSLSKGILSRRKLGVPNPKQFSDLSEQLVNNWNELKKVYAMDNFSESIPIEFGALRAIRTKK